MTTANKITLVRIVMIPVFLVLLLCESIPYHMWIAAVWFAVAAFTDGLDGHIARSRNQITTFGKFADPLADKLLISAAVIGFVEVFELPSWIAFVIIAREFIVTGLRLIAISDGKVIAASMVGKVKTVVQIVAILLCMVIDSSIQVWDIALTTWLMGIAAVVTVYSGVCYLVQNRGLLHMK